MRFLIDAQLPPALARWLESKGHEASHVGDLNLISAEGTEIWDYALSRGAVIVTKDADFSIRTVRSSPSPSVVWVLPLVRDRACLAAG